MNAHPFTILYVEDNDFIRESFADLLATPERRIVLAADGAGARAALREQNVSLLMTDVELPDGSGLDVAREALLQHPQLPVILCSGYDVTDAARSLGPTAHALRKPVDLDDIEALIDEIAQRAQLAP